jgi:hypothetical protein
MILVYCNLKRLNLFLANFNIVMTLQSVLGIALVTLKRFRHILSKKLNFFQKSYHIATQFFDLQCVVKFGQPATFSTKV